MSEIQKKLVISNYRKDVELLNFILLNFLLGSIKLTDSFFITDNTILKGEFSITFL